MNSPRYPNGGRNQGAFEALHDFCVQKIPFLLGKRGGFVLITAPEKLCRAAVAMILQVSRKYLYTVGRKDRDGRVTSLSECIFDEAGERVRQSRRNGKWYGYPTIRELQSFDCRCEDPCPGGITEKSLRSLYALFKNVLWV